MTARPTINMLLSGVGGQGVVLASFVLSHVAMSEGYDVKQSEVHGMSQRGGSVTSHFRFGDKVWAPLVSPGTADILMAFEALEALRYVNWLKPGGLLVYNALRINPSPVSAGLATYPEDIDARIAAAWPQRAVRQRQRAGQPRPAPSRRPTWSCWAPSRRPCRSPPETWEAVIRKAVPPKTVDVNLAGLPAGGGEREAAPAADVQDPLAGGPIRRARRERRPRLGAASAATSPVSRHELRRSRRYRWVVLGMGFLAVFGALGFGRFGYSAILPSMQKDLGISSAAAGSLASWNLAGYVIMAAIGGLLASRFGPRKVVGYRLGRGGRRACSSPGFPTGMVDGLARPACSPGWAAGMVLVPSVALMSAWFDVRRRGMASGIVSSGSSLALVITGPVVPRIIAAGGADGWRLAWYFFAALTFLVGVLTVRVPARPAPTRPTRKAPRRPAAKTSTTRACCAPATPGIWASSTCMFGFAYMVYFTFFQKRLTADLGFSPAQGGHLFLILGVVSIFCGVIWGTISDRIGRGRALAVMYLLQAAAAVLFALWPSTPGLVLSAVLFGLTAIAVPGIVGAGCGDQFGPVLASASLGFVTIFLGIGQVLGPYPGAAGWPTPSAPSSTRTSWRPGSSWSGRSWPYFLRETGWLTAVGARQVEQAAARRRAGRHSTQAPGRAHDMNDPLDSLRPDHAGISVADLEASIAWYGEMLGFTVDRIVDIPEDTGRLALIRNGDFLLELFCVAGSGSAPRGAPPPGHRPAHPGHEARGLRGRATSAL